MTRARAVILVLLAALGAGGFWLVHTGRLGRKHAPTGELTLYGNVDVRQVELGFRVSGRVRTMHFEEGETVPAGAIMATLDSRAFEDDLRAAQAQASVQRAALDKLLAGSRPAEILRAAASVDEAKAGQDNAHVELERAKKLLADDAIPQASYDDALARSRQADARVDAAVQSHRLELQGSRAEDIAGGRAALQVAQARVASSQTSLDDTRLVAPEEGVVTSRVREPGAIVSPNDVVYVVSLTRSVWVRAFVSEVELGKVKPGMPVQVFSDAAPSKAIAAHVGFISPTAEFTPKSVETPDLRTDLVYRMRVIVDAPDPALRQGMPVTLRIHTGGA